MKNLFVIIVAVLFFTSCEEANPLACFDASNDKPLLNEEISFENCSNDGDNYHWEFGDGNSSNEKSPTHSYSTSMDYPVTLIAYSESGEKQSVVTSVMEVQNQQWYAGYGDVQFWRDGSGVLSSDFTVIQIYGTPEGFNNMGTTDKVFAVEPSCGSDQGASFNLPIGTYNGWDAFNTVNGNSVSGGSFTITKDECLLIKMD